MPKIIRLFLSLLLVFTVAFAASYFTMPAIDGWYRQINRPGFTPPSWVFGPAWTILYFLMAVALTRVWGKGELEQYLLFVGQLLLNGLWSFLFFGQQNPLLGLVDIVFLWVLILLTIISFAKIDKTASLLLYPYLAWVTFAAALNFGVFLLN